MSDHKATVKIIANGPFIVQGPVTIVHPDGTEETKELRCSLCSCGKSSNHPYCDGTHKSLNA